MKLIRRKLLRSLFLTLAVCAMAGSAAAQNYPNRPIRLVVPFPPAGVTDLLGRAVAERLSVLYDQSIVVENKPGASGHLGAQQVAKAAGDGYTLMVGTIGIHAAYASYRKLGYDPAAELQPILILGEAPNLVLVPVSSPYQTFVDFLADAGSSVHMVTALFELASGVKLNHVPYKGSGPALVDLMGAQVDVMFDNLSSGLPQVQNGKLRALAVTGAKRDPRLPKLPTVAESGVPGYSGTSWFSLAAPRSMPAALVDKLNKDVLRALATPEAQARFDTLGIGFTPNTPAEATAFFKSETLKWNRVIQAAKLQLD
jgi:tripartite-type tricarboxylate transporter receptor subunit TctC